MGRLYGHSLSTLLAAWLGIIAVVVAGSTNLYWIARRWGPAMLRVVHLDERRLEKAHGWFDRWGVWAIIFGRHIPGFRIAITVIAATMGVPYRVFVPSVAVSTAIWAAWGSGWERRSVRRSATFSSTGAGSTSSSCGWVSSPWPSPWWSPGAAGVFLALGRHESISEVAAGRRLMGSTGDYPTAGEPIPIVSGRAPHLPV